MGNVAAIPAAVGPAAVQVFREVWWHVAAHHDHPL